MEFEREISEQKAKFEKNREQQKAATQATEECKSSTAATLPQLSMTRFSGLIEESLILWEIYLRIDSTDQVPLSKFGYLKELLEKHVRKDIDELSFKEEAYEDA